MYVGKSSNQIGNGKRSGGRREKDKINSLCLGTWTKLLRSVCINYCPVLTCLWQKPSTAQGYWWIASHGCRVPDSPGCVCSSLPPIPERSLTRKLARPEVKSTVLEPFVSFLSFSSIFEVNLFYLICVGEWKMAHSSVELKSTAVSVAAYPPGACFPELFLLKKLWKWQQIVQVSQP